MHQSYFLTHMMHYSGISMVIFHPFPLLVTCGLFQLLVAIINVRGLIVCRDIYYVFITLYSERVEVWAGYTYT